MCSKKEQLIRRVTAYCEIFYTQSSRIVVLNYLLFNFFVQLLKYLRILFSLNRFNKNVQIYVDIKSLITN